MRRLLIILSLIALFLAGLRLLIFQVDFPWAQNMYLEAIRPLNIPMRIFLTVLVMLLPVLVLVDVWRCYPSRRKLALRARDGGRLELRESVIEKIVRQSVAELPEIERLRVRASSGRKGLRVHIGVKAREVRSLPDLDEAIRIRADQSLRRILGIEEVNSVDVSLEDMSSSERSSPSVGETSVPPYPPARTSLTPEPATVSISPPATAIPAASMDPVEPTQAEFEPVQMIDEDEEIDLDQQAKEHDSEKQI